MSLSNATMYVALMHKSMQNYYASSVATDAVNNELLMKSKNFSRIFKRRGSRSVRNYNT